MYSFLQGRVNPNQQSSLAFIMAEKAGTRALKGGFRFLVTISLHPLHVQRRIHVLSFTANPWSALVEWEGENMQAGFQQYTAW